MEWGQGSGSQVFDLLSAWWFEATWDIDFLVPAPRTSGIEGLWSGRVNRSMEGMVMDK